MRSLANLGINYRDAGQMEECFRCFDEALSLARKRPGPPTADWVQLQGEMASVFDRAEKLDKAEAVYRELLNHAQKQYGRFDARTATLMAQLGSNLLRQKRYSEAQAILNDCLVIRAKADPDAWTTFNTKSALGGALLGQKKFAEAKQCYDKAISSRTDSPDPFYRRALCELELNDFAGAASDLERVVQKDGNYDYQRAAGLPGYAWTAIYAFGAEPTAFRSEA